MIARLRKWAELVTFSHTIFMMPFAAAAVVLAMAVPHEKLTPLRLGAIVLCMVCARTSAMAFNRWADRDIDAKNDRTKGRPVASGRIAPREALILTVVSGLAFCGFASLLGRWPALLSFPVLLVLLGYSLAKRFTWAAHAWLGFALALAPGGAWVGMGATPNSGILALMVAVLTWLLGFDVLYALQDEKFDRAHGLFSIPSRFGTRGAMRIAAVSHVVTVAMLAATGYFLQRGIVFFLGVIAVAVVLVIEHRLVRPRDASQGEVDLSQIGKAFFDCNAYVSLGFFATTLVDGLLR
ncbi:4-hydroxybenzoate polyprenyltransferase [Labilithrix luteola]|uniref:4-hydroxybenzoate polyprenyltransferase n=1 Tax=Labilithrix luteola TaxID=1391654 RepID=A0A0K1Q3E9_9BACT|nr:4-hydroxybenzoate octaprenyltransferase [Labilithrix luteola]AKU99894.1 4-hydroxybenzoate polyprenyltransferase [Labilithrix luteola]